MTAQYILDGTTPVLEPDLLTWARWFETANRHVAETWVTPTVRVSTIFLGLDHQLGQGPPLLFETMCFKDGECWDMDRCSTWEQAEVLHQRIVEKVQHDPTRGPEPSR